MKTVQRFKMGDPIPSDGKFIRTEVVRERLSLDELYKIGWPGLGSVPHREVQYAWYEIPVTPPQGERT